MDREQMKRNMQQDANKAKRSPSYSGITNGIAYNYDIYMDDNGYQMKVIYGFDGKPFRVEIGKAGSDFEKTKEVINQATLEHNGVSDVYVTSDGRKVQGLSNYNKIIKNLRNQAVTHPNFSEIYDQYKPYQVQPVTPEELQRRSQYQQIYNQWKTDFEKMYKFYGGGFTYDGDSKIWDNSIQGYHRGLGLFISEKSTEYNASIELDTTGKVNSITLGSPIDFGKSGYVEVINIDSLQKQGYSTEEAENILQQKAEQIRKGTSLKQMFTDNRRFMGEQSKEKLQKDMAKYNEQQKPDTSRLRKMPEYGGR